MREFTVQITDVVKNGELVALVTPSLIKSAGFAGEHNASRLIFCLPESWSSDWEYSVVCSTPEGGCVTDTLTVNETDGKKTVYVDITEDMTVEGTLNLSLQGVERDGEEKKRVTRSATVDVIIDSSPTVSKQIATALKALYENLIAKYNSLVERFNRGDFNGKDGKDGEKGEKGDKGDKGDKGEDGVFSDELADEITLNTAARHTHGNKELLDSLTESMIGTLDVYHELPETANDGDICIYSPANVPTVADSGKLIYVDWDVFNKTITDGDFTQFAINFYDANEEEVGFFYATNTGIGTAFQYIKGNEQWDIQFADGVFVAESSSYTDGETTAILDKAPESFTLPYFSSYTTDNYNINGDVFYAPIKLMVYRGGWYEYTSAATVNINIGHGHELPENAKEGDLFLYAPQNTLTLADSGKRIYFDWEEFKEPVSNGETSYSFTSYNETLPFSFSVFRGTERCEVVVDKNADDFSQHIQINFKNGEIEAEYSLDETSGPSGTETTYYNGIGDLPAYVNLPQFNELYSDLTGNAYLFYTEYRLMKYQGGEWTEIASSGGNNSGSVDLSGYYTKTEIDNKGFITAEDIPADRIESTENSTKIKPNTNYSFGEATTLTLEFAEGDTAKVNEYSFTFISGATPAVLTLPSSVQWVNELTVEANKRYEISIVDNIGLWCAVEVSE